MDLPEDRRAIDARIAEREAEAIVDKLWHQRERGSVWLETIDKALAHLEETTAARIDAFRGRMHALQKRRARR